MVESRDENDRSGGARWKCKCDCGNYLIVTGNRLRIGRIKSCGCQKRLRVNIGDKFQELTAIKEQSIDKNGNSICQFQCSCGKVKTLKLNYVITSKVKTCGCSKNNRGLDNKSFKDLTGMIFGDLKVNKYVGFNESSGRHQWECVCQCQRTCIVNGGALTIGNTKTCGCSRRRKGKLNSSFKGFEEISMGKWLHIISHAKSRGLEFNITIEYGWKLFIDQNRKCKLSGLPIGFQSRDIKQTASLDRIDSSKGYIEGNVQWLHKHINKMKWDFKEDEFINYCKLIVNNII